jgi:hypothetical protein
MIVISDNKTHQTTCYNAEMTRQAAESAAIAAGGGSTAIQLALKNAEVVFYRAIIASCLANGIEAGGFREGLFNLTGSRS